MPKRNHYLFVCTNRRADDNPKGSCAFSGSEAVLETLKKALFERGLAKTELRACGSTCLDLCHVAPAIAVEPDGFFYGNVTQDDVPAILDALARGERVERLVVRDDQFDSAPVAKERKG